MPFVRLCTPKIYEYFYPRNFILNYLFEPALTHEQQENNLDKLTLAYCKTSEDSRTATIVHSYPGNNDQRSWSFAGRARAKLSQKPFISSLPHFHLRATLRK